jgi:hypothetical protein
VAGAMQQQKHQQVENQRHLENQRLLKDQTKDSNNNQQCKFKRKVTQTS